MAQESDKIKIKTATTNPPGNDGNGLKNCYFLLTNQAGKYVFFDSTGTPIVTNPMPISATGSFTFSLNSFTWQVPNPATGSEAFAISGSGTTAIVSGSWANNDTSAPTQSVGNDPSLGGDPTGESGTFQGQAGGTLDETEDAASAAKA